MAVCNSQSIVVQGARTHNLKNITVEIPRSRLVVITGLSGSGKSSLAFDTLYAEGQRRYVESLSAYARQFLSVMPKPEVDYVSGLSPAIAIEQKTVSRNPRSTVGTVTEIYDYLRLLYARIGHPYCPEHQLKLKAQSVSQMVDYVLALPSGSKVLLLAPFIQYQRVDYRRLLEELGHKGFIRVRIDGKVFRLDTLAPLDSQKKYCIEVVVDRLKVLDDLRLRLTESFETALELGNGVAQIVCLDEEGVSDEPIIFSANFACPHCGYSIEEVEPRLFSFNSPLGACKSCNGLGVKEVFDPQKVVQTPELSLENGAIRGWGHQQVYYHRILLDLALHYKFDIETPFEQLSEAVQKVVLYGTGVEMIQFHTADRRAVPTYLKPFEGVIPSMQRRYLETKSAAVRGKLSACLSSQACPDCQGFRLCLSARHIYVAEKSLPDLVSLPVKQLSNFFDQLQLSDKESTIAHDIIKEIKARLSFLQHVGLAYLSLDRQSGTLSGGEAQRIRLASQIGSGLVGVMYVLDEPSIGLHQRDNQRLLEILCYLRDLGNSVIVIEHDEDAILKADYVIDMGPGAGVYGGQVIAMGLPEQIKANKDSLTGQYLSGKQSISLPKRRRAYRPDKILQFEQIYCNNLQGIDITIPVGLLTCITGVSGSGKSTVMNETIYPLLANRLRDTHVSIRSQCKSIHGLEHFDKIIAMTQAPIGRTPRSNPATYTGIFTLIRELFACTAEAQSRGYTSGRFSFNVRGGRCEACQGGGVVKVEMHFLADIYVTCDICKGKRYNRETLEILYKGQNINQVLQQTVAEALEFFSAVPPLLKRLSTLNEVGLSYVQLGQNAVTLSGGEAQRIKLAKELSKRSSGNTLYLLDEPTTGLHFHDIKHLLHVLMQLRDCGNSIIVIEHHLDVIKVADWVIDLGPEGGSDGGQVIVVGTPEDVAAYENSHTGRYLRLHLKLKDKKPRKV